jgi:hypothetical protein
MLRILLAEAIDYAGLFPPAGLDMRTAARNYAEYRGGDDAWALGRFVVPASRLRELERAAEDLLAGGGAGRPWRISALAGAAPADVAEVEAFNDRQSASDAAVDAIELTARSPAEVTRAAEVVPRSLETFLEIPVDDDPRELLGAIATAGVHAKVRTGGVAPDAFPAPAQLARFIACCAAARVAFKATAGLHHPLRGEYRLTYDSRSACATMFGFLNVLLAAALARDGASERDLVAALEERSAAAIEAEGEGLVWRGRRLSASSLGGARRDLVRSFGSCSFREPLDDLEELGLL